MKTSTANAALIVFFSLCLCCQNANGQDPNQQVRSLLSNKCFACHGPDEEAREAGLRLDTREGAIEWAIDLDDPESSEVMDRIRSDDPEIVMPPPKHGKALTKQQKQLVLNWIKEGAPYVKHWSYQKPNKPSVPAIDTDSTFNEIDRFVQAKLVGTELRPSSTADRYTLIRRLALDLTGLPPTLDEVDQFIADQSPTAYENLVDYYLAKPAYGERWASVWLDLARYADSAGYAEDRPRTIWAFRDYVIRAYNENKPFDQFTIEQIAGDLLADATEETKIATAFHRNTLTNSEGGTSDEEFRSAAVVDRVNTTMAVWMGTTMACAQCHTHKYDPITQAEYFSFYDFFNQTADNDRPDEKPVVEIYSDDSLKKREKIRNQIAQTQARLSVAPTQTEFEDWLGNVRSAESLQVKGQFVRVDLPGKDKILSLAEVEVLVTDAEGKTENVALAGTASQSSTGYDGPAGHANDGKTDGDFTKKSVTHTNSQNDPWWEIDLGQLTAVDSIRVWHRTDNKLFRRSNGFRISVLDADKNQIWKQEFKKATKAAQEAVVQSVPANIKLLIGKSSAELTADEVDLLKKYHAGVVRAKTELAVSQLQAKLNKVKPTTSVPVLESVAENMQRETKVQIRGNYLMTDETVTAGTPSVFHPLAEGEQRNRLGVAKWLVDENNPLTARVVVNRYWEQLFGVGLVETSEEFGAQGELPSHPNLLDWLASDLMEHHWDRRRLLKQIVLSSTYRQSSMADSVSRELDPKNRLLSRGPRVRLTAEMIRDQALSVSGLMSSKMYGPPVQPPQPKVGLKPAFTGKTTDWTDSTGENRYRRGIYTEWRRSSPYPSMSTFDVNSREVCEVRRTSTNTPLQALVTLNDPVFVESAQALGRRILFEDSLKDDRARAEFAFRVCLIRRPTEQELDRIVGLYSQTHQHFVKRQAAAKQLAVDPLNPPPPKTDLYQLAAWTTVANVLLNLDEMLLKP